jgi:exodeoxyribonuclease-5
MVTPIALDAVQQQAIDRVRARRTGVLGITGPAGSGKTTLIKTLIAVLGDRLEALASPTGKAAACITEATGAPAHTLHSLLMRPVYIEQPGRGVYDRIGSRRGKMISRPRGATLPAGKVLIVDEASMVDRRMYDELAAYGRAGLVVLIGDDSQLPPVASGGFSVFDIAAVEIIELTKVFRQGPGSDILRAVESLRIHANAGNPRPLEALRDLPRVDQYELMEAMRAGFAEHGPKNFAVITYRNQARDEITTAYRAHIGFEPRTINVGEPLVITRNSSQHGLYNGDICTFVDWLDDGETYRLGDADHHIRCATLFSLRTSQYLKAALLLTASSLSVEAREQLDRDFGTDETVVLIAEYGYVLTAHKAQGSEWQHVLVAYDEMFANNAEQRYRWAYTAITRAALSCTICELHRSSPLCFLRPTPPSSEQIATSPLLKKLMSAPEVR